MLEPRKEVFTGTCLAAGSRAELTGILLDKRPQHCNHLSGLLELYRTKATHSKTKPV